MTAEKLVLTGRILTWFVALFLLFDSVIKLLRHSAVLEAFSHLQIPAELAVSIGILQLVCLAIFLWPRTEVLGAVLLTGYPGGAIFAHLRMGDPFFSQTIFPVYIGGMVWGGLYLRNDRVRALLD